MSKIAFMVYIIAAPTLAGIAVVVILTMGLTTAKMVTISAAVGALIAIPFSWIVAKSLAKLA